MDIEELRDLILCDPQSAAAFVHDALPRLLCPDLEAAPAARAAAFLVCLGRKAKLDVALTRFYDAFADRLADRSADDAEVQALETAVADAHSIATTTGARALALRNEAQPDSATISDVPDRHQAALAKGAVALVEAICGSLVRPDEDTFDERAYLRENVDVSAAVLQGLIDSAWEQFSRFGKHEGRVQRLYGPASLVAL